MATKSRFKKTSPKFILTGVLPHTGENFLKEAKSLDEVTEAGIYMLTGNNVSSADGLPDVVGSATHCFDAQLIVTSNMGENSTKDKGVKGQMLILSNLNDVTTNIFTRTWKEKSVNAGEWTPWLMMLGGDISVVAPSNEIAEKVSVLSTTINSEIKRSQEAEKANADAIASEVIRAKAAEQANADAIMFEELKSSRFPLLIDGFELAYTEKSAINIDGTLSASTNNVSDYFPAIRGMALYNVRTSPVGYVASIAFYDRAKKCLGYYQGGPDSVEDVVVPDIPEGCFYMRYQTKSNIVPTIGYRIQRIEALEDKLNEIVGDNRDIIYVIGSSSMQRLENVNIVGDYLLDKLTGRKIVWSGVGGENMQAIIGRAAISPIHPCEAFTIPSDVAKVAIGSSFIVDEKTTIFFNQQGANLPKLNPVTICGIKGSVAMEGSVYYFTREVKGESVSVAITDVIIPQNIQYRGNTLITALGYNGGYSTVEEYIKYHRKAVLTNGNGKYILLTRLCDNSWSNISAIQEEENALVAEFGGNVLCLRDWLSRFGIKKAIELGLLSNETEQDVDDTTNGYVPTSLRGGGVHLNDIGYKVLSVKLKEMIDVLRI